MMDIVAILRERLGSLPDGTHSVGLEAVLRHIDAAVAHLERGKNGPDGTAFTDAVYRTNHAFEGSLKEAYRVLAGKDPSRRTPDAIERYLKRNHLLRPRVLDEFRNYRQQWRNPSTHDYVLDFDEAEALLAIVSVCAFAVVLTDQIAERIAFDRVLATAEIAHAQTGGSLLTRIGQLLEQFSASEMTASSSGQLREVELIGAIAGFLTVALPTEEVRTDVALSSALHAEVDFVVGRSGEGVLIEVKRSPLTPSAVEHAVAAVTRYMELGGFRKGVLYVHPAQPGSRMIAREMRASQPGSRILVLTPDERAGS